jgi:dTDP-4-amino-4,6-dideoxygalactose transaminase
MNIPFLDLRPSDEKEKNLILDAVERVISSGKLILGAEVKQFEALVSEYTNRKFAIGVSSGTDALILAMRALNIGYGDEVIVPCLSWVAVANAIINVGATPVFAEVMTDLNISPCDIEVKISPRTKAVIAVHSSGRMCNIKKIQEICNKNGIFLIEDASQAFGAKRDFLTAGSTGKVSCISLNPMKTLGALGEAGVVLTNDISLYEKILLYRNQGMRDKDHCETSATNMRMDTIQAAILIKRLLDIEGKIDRRRKLADLYKSQIDKYVVTPSDPDDGRHVYFVYTIQIDNRNELESFFKSVGIETRVRDRILVPRQIAFSKYNSEQFIESQYYADRMISLPFFEGITTDQINFVCKKLEEFCLLKGALK